MTSLAMTMLEPHALPALETAPHVIVRGEGIRVWDSEGRSYLDGTSGMLCTNLGYTQPRLVAAATKQMSKLPFYALFGHRTNDVALALADDLASISPIPMGRTLFANSGAEAVDSAIKLAWYYHNCMGRSGRSRILSHRRGYHGTTVAGASGTGLDFIHSGFGLPLSNFVKLPSPRSAGGSGPNTRELHRWPDRTPGGGHRDGGPRHNRGVYRRACPGRRWHRHSTGRLLPPFGGRTRPSRHPLHRRRGHHRLWPYRFDVRHQGVRPEPRHDHPCQGALVGVSADIGGHGGQASHRCRRQRLDGHRLIGHGLAYSGHPVSAAVARENIAILVDNNIPDHVRKTGPTLMAGLEPFRGKDGVVDVRGHGFMAAVTFAPLDSSPGGDGAMGAAVMDKAARQGVLVRAIGDTVAFAPPLISTAAEITEITDRFGPPTTPS